MIYVPLFHPKVTGLFPAKSAALFNRYLLQFSIVIYIQKAYTDEMVKSACEVIVNYISKDFSGQIKLTCA